LSTRSRLEWHLALQKELASSSGRRCLLIHYFVRMLRQMSQSSLATSQSADDGWADNWLTRRSEMLLLMNEMTNCYYYGNLCISYMVAS
jgi:hypothetical protein